MKFKHISNFIKEHRVKAKLSQKELAKATGMHMQAISNVERGRASVPLFRTKKLAKVLKVPPLEIYKCILNDFEDGAKKKAGL